MNNVHPVFSISALALVAFVGTGSAYMLNNNHKVEKLIQEEPAVLKSMNIPQDVPVVVDPPTSIPEAPKAAPPKRVVPKKPTPAPMKVAIASSPQPCEMVCGDWAETALGTHVKSCECKK
jgi:hypothetical protein